jgi:hypothetical protein
MEHTLYREGWFYGTFRLDRQAAVPESGPHHRRGTFIFEEFLRAMGDGFDGHVVTIGHALVELYRMGQKELACKGVPAYWQWVREAPAGENEGPGEVAPAPPHAPTPLNREYWAAQAKHRFGEIVSSHTVKYPYSFYALATDVTDEDLKKRILAKVYRLTATS